MIKITIDIDGETHEFAGDDIALNLMTQMIEVDPQNNTRTFKAGKNLMVLSLLGAKIKEPCLKRCAITKTGVFATHFYLDGRKEFESGLVDNPEIQAPHETVGG